jgi:hypothetical protein
MYGAILDCFDSSDYFEYEEDEDHVPSKFALWQGMIVLLHQAHLCY